MVLKKFIKVSDDIWEDLYLIKIKNKEKSLNEVLKKLISKKGDIDGKQKTE